MKLTYFSSFMDDAFRKNLESALRFGNPLLVQVRKPIFKIDNHVEISSCRMWRVTILFSILSLTVRFVVLVGVSSSPWVTRISISRLHLPSFCPPETPL